MDKRKLLSGLVAVLGAGSASAATYDLSLTADAGSRWFEYYSDAYYELGKYRGDSSSVPGADGAWQISEYFGNGVDVSFGSGDVAFATADFANIGVIDYDETGLTGAGSESAAITGLNIDFFQYVAYSSATGTGTDVLGVGYSTTVNTVTGTMDFLNGSVSGINLAADVTLTYPTASVLGVDTEHAGTFTIDGADFSLLAGVSTYDPAQVGQLVWGWNVTGVTASEVPVPAAAWLFGSALIGLFGTKRKR